MRLLNSLDEDSNKTILNTALRKGANKLAADTRTNLRARLGAGATSPNRWNGKTMESGITTKADKDYIEVSVAILGDFRLKIFEKGNFKTFNRPTRKGYSRGNIKGLNFFSDARNREGEIIGTINESLRNSLNKLNQ